MLRLAPWLIGLGLVAVLLTLLSTMSIWLFRAMRPDFWPTLWQTGVVCMLTGAILMHGRREA